jgi:hypothetical protein
MTWWSPSVPTCKRVFALAVGVVHDELEGSVRAAVLLFGGVAEFAACKACTRVVMRRAPLAPSGWPDGRRASARSRRLGVKADHKAIEADARRDARLDNPRERAFGAQSETGVLD